MRDRHSHTETINLLHSYFSIRDDVLLVLLFGSSGTDREHALSDIDIAVLLKNSPHAPIKRGYHQKDENKPCF